MRFVVDAVTGQRTSDDPAVTRNRMSWARLAETLKASGDVRHHERLTHFIVDEDDGLQLCYETKGSR